MSLAWCESMKGRKGEEGKRRGGALYKCPKKLGGDMEKMKAKKILAMGIVAMLMIGVGLVGAVGLAGANDNKVEALLPAYSTETSAFNWTLLPRLITDISALNWTLLPAYCTETSAFNWTLLPRLITDISTLDWTLLPAYCTNISDLEWVELDSQPSLNEVIHPDEADTRQINITPDMIKELGPKVESEVIHPDEANITGHINLTSDRITFKELGPESEVIHPDEANITGHINLTSDRITFKELGPKVEEVGPLATYHISGTIDPDQWHCYGPVDFEQGDTARIRLTWSPGSTLVVAMLDSSGHYWGDAVAGGTCDVTLVCPVSGQYHICIWNKGSVTIEYDGSITI